MTVGTLPSPDEALAYVQSGDWTAERWAEWYGEHEQAKHEAQQAARLLITPHVLRAPAKTPGRMSGPRYFNLIRAIEADPERYADYRPTTYCGAPRTSEDWDRRSALAKKNAVAVVERGVCADCLHRAEAGS